MSALPKSLTKPVIGNKIDRLTSALAFTLRWEGGYVNDPKDPGGATNYGITQRTYDKWRSDHKEPLHAVKLITIAEVKLIYELRYWDAAKCSSLSKPLDMIHFDTAVNFGVTRANEFLSKALVATSTTSSGTISGSTNHSVDAIADAYIKQRIKYRHARVAARPDQAKFLRGWLNRDNALHDYAFAKI